jgi:integration host factor subunit beta
MQYYNYNKTGIRIMTKSELIEVLARKQNQLPYKDVELAVKTLIEQMSQSLATGNRIEIRGFGSFSLHFRPPRVGRNPKTGESVSLSGSMLRTSSLVRNCVNALMPLRRITLS